MTAHRHLAASLLLLLVAGCDSPGTSAPPAPPPTDRLANVAPPPGPVADTASTPRGPASAEPGTSAELDARLKDALADARRETKRQTAWLRARLERRLTAPQRGLSAAEDKLASLKEAAARGEPKLPSKEARLVASLERKAARLRARLLDLSSQYTEALLEKDPLARRLRTQLEQIGQEIATHRTTGASQLMSEARANLALAQSRVAEVERDNREALARLASFAKDLETSRGDSMTTDAGGDLEKAERALISAWTPVWRPREERAATRTAEHDTPSVH